MDSWSWKRFGEPFIHFPTPAEILFRVSLAFIQSLFEYSCDGVHCFSRQPISHLAVYTMVGAQRMLVGRNDIEQRILHRYLLSSAEQRRTHLPSLLLQELLNIQNSASLPPWHLLIPRHSVVLFQAHLRRIEHPGLTDRTCVVTVLLYFLAFYDLVLSSYGFLESRLCTGSEIFTSLTWSLYFY